MIRVTAALAFLLTTTTAFAQRPSTIAMSCGQARQVISTRGAAILGTGGQTYDRFVRDRSFCQPTETTRAAFVPTRETPSCFVGYRCYEPSRSDWFFD